MEAKAIAYDDSRFVAAGYDGNAVYGSLPNITARLVFSADGVVRWVKE